MRKKTKEEDEALLAVFTADRSLMSDPTDFDLVPVTCKAPPIGIGGRGFGLVRGVLVTAGLGVAGLATGFVVQVSSPARPSPSASASTPAEFIGVPSPSIPSGPPTTPTPQPSRAKRPVRPTASATLSKTAQRSAGPAARTSAAELDPDAADPARVDLRVDLRDGSLIVDVNVRLSDGEGIAVVARAVTSDLPLFAMRCSAAGGGAYACTNPPGRIRQDVTYDLTAVVVQRSLLSELNGLVPIDLGALLARASMASDPLRLSGQEMTG